MNDKNIWTERMHQHQSRSADFRTAYDVDYSRVAHSEYYRRLAYKSQILSVGGDDGDYHRNRLTHTIEVGQIALGLIQYLQATLENQEIIDLLPSRPLMETIAAVHDIGHPPYGHGGEVALNYCMREHGGFEGNGQTLRILARLLEGSSTRPGGNLTRNTLLGALKYPVPYSMVTDHDRVMQDSKSPITGENLLVHKWHEPPKCYLDTETDIVQWLMSPFSTEDQKNIVKNNAKTLAASLMDCADDCAYGPGDLEDAITLKLVTRDQMMEDINSSHWSEYLEVMSANYPHGYRHHSGRHYEAFLDNLFGDGTKEECGRIIHYMITNCHIKTRGEYEEPMYRYTADIRPQARTLLNEIKKTVMKRVIRCPEVQQLRFKGQQMIVKLFAYYQHDPRHLLPAQVQAKHAQAETESDKMRVICDFVATMTDTGMVRAYRRMFSAGVGSVFDEIR